MPTYEYECQACKVRFERKQSFSDEPIKVCPDCGAETRRVFQPAPIIFKGSGWYVTDSRSSQSATVPAPASGEGTSGEPAKSESGKADATKAESTKSDASKSGGGGSSAAASGGSGGGEKKD